MPLCRTTGSRNSRVSREENYELTRSRLIVEGDDLLSAVNGKRYGVGALEAPTIAGF
jgi:hypothetical protein